MEQRRPKFEPNFQLKGGLYPLTSIQLLNHNIEGFESQLQAKVQQAPNFFDNAPILIDLSKLKDNNEVVDFTRLINILRANRLIPVGVRGGSEQQHQSAILAELAVLPEQRYETQTATPAAAKPAPTNTKPAAAKTTNTTAETATPAPQAPELPAATKVITAPVRSGQQIYAPMGDIIVMNHVSGGAELIAAGHIHVYGALRGRALAGIHGNTDAKIFCHKLEAELVSIAGNYLVSDDLNQQPQWEHDAVVQLQNDKLHLSSI